MKNKKSKKHSRDNVVSMDLAVLGRWTMELTDEEFFILWNGSLSMALTERVNISEEEVEMLGGACALAAILDNIEKKAERLRLYKQHYDRVHQMLRRVRKKFKVA